MTAIRPLEASKVAVGYDRFTSNPAVGCAQIALPPRRLLRTVKSTLSERAARTNDYSVVEDTTAAEDSLLDRVVPRLAEVYEIPGTG